MAAEYFDLLDENGNPTGEKKLRSEVHRDGDWHKGIHAWIMNDNQEFLIQKRSPDKDCDPGKWTRSITGHVVSGEDSLTTVIVECKEELGINVEEKDVRYLYSAKKQIVLNDGLFINNELDDIFLIKTNPRIEDITLQEDEVSEVKYISALDVREILSKGDSSFVAEPEEDPIFLEYLNRIIAKSTKG